MTDVLTQRVSTGYKPRVLQKELHLGLKRFNVIVCHRRFGKTHFAINEIISKALENKLVNPQYAYIAPTYGQAKKIVWDILKWYLKDIPGVEFNEAELRADIYRAGGQRIRIMLLGAENPGSLKGLYLDGAVFDEFAEQDPRVWSEAVRPALSDRLGWACFIGTPKGMNHFYDIYEMAKKNNTTWFTAIYRASETKILPQTECDEMKLSMSEEEYDQELECSFTAALVGAYYGKRLEAASKENRITRVPYDPALGTKTFWDLGVNDTTVIWFIQQIQNRYHAIDYYEMSGMGLDHYVKILKEKPYSYDEHIFPHDVAARSLETGKSREEVLRGLGVKPLRVLPRLSVSDGIEAARMILPRVWFDEVKCSRGIDALKNYQKKWDAKNKIFSDQPLHNWASNGADAFRAFAIGSRDYDNMKDRKNLQRQADSNYNIWEV
jgi:phage terminase large subunit